MVVSTLKDVLRGRSTEYLVNARMRAGLLICEELLKEPISIYLYLLREELGSIVKTTGEPHNLLRPVVFELFMRAASQIEDSGNSQRDIGDVYKI